MKSPLDEDLELNMSKANITSNEYWRFLPFAVLLLRCISITVMVQAGKTVQSTSEDHHVLLGSLLKMATWNVGGLSFTNRGSIIVYARIRAEPCNLFLIGVYIHHLHRHEAPFFSDTLQQLEDVLHKATRLELMIALLSWET